jgi:PAS domain S-box-containing protein
VEHEIKRVDGHWFLMRLHPYRTRHDHIEGVVITFTDISQLKESEQQLSEAKVTLEEHVEERTRELAQANEQIRQARDMFFTLFHSNPIPTSLTKVENGTFLNVNEAYLEFAGVQRDQLLGRSAPEMGLPVDASIRPRIIEQLRDLGIIENLELQVRRASGEISTVLSSIQLINLDETEALLLAFIDITERVKAEQQIRSLAYDLTMAEQEERRRISQILHDDLQQRIFAIKMQISSLSEAYQQGDREAAEVDFAQLQTWLDESISVTRNLSIDLSPAILNGEGLTDALIWLSAQMQDQYGLHVALHSDGIRGRYEDSLRILIFQAVREILFNIVKHANTSEATISMSRASGHTRLTIRDDGVGFDAQAVLRGSKTAGGLLNLQHRLNLVGCTIQIHSQPNAQGTQVIIDIPSDK